MDPSWVNARLYCWWLKSCTSWGTGSLYHYLRRVLIHPRGSPDFWTINSSKTLGDSTGLEVCEFWFLWSDPGDCFLHWDPGGGWDWWNCVVRLGGLWYPAKNWREMSDESIQMIPFPTLMWVVFCSNGWGGNKKHISLIEEPTNGGYTV